MENEGTCISVIIPVYKVGAYLPACVDSILAQTFTDFELLLVDDGSPDNSGIICDNYAEKDSRVKVFHQANGGVSCARNCGLEHAKGKWIAFVDSDDYVGKDYLQDLYDAVDEKVDLVIQSFSHIKENGEKLFGDSERNGKNGVYFPSDFRQMQQEWHLEMRCHPISKLFKRRIIEDNKIEFTQKVTLGEDFLFLFSYLNVISGGGVSVSLIDNYFYVDRANSLVHKKRSFEELFTLYCYAKNVTFNFIQKYNCQICDFDITNFLHRAITVAESPKDLLKISQDDWILFVEYFKVISRKTALDKWMVSHFHSHLSVLFFYLHAIRSFREALEKRNLWAIVDFLKK